MLTLTIVIPTYNEVANIGVAIERIAEVSRTIADLDLTVAVVDDASPDGTAAAARAVGERLAAEHLRVRVFDRASKNGLGAAYIWAFDRLLAEPDVSRFVLQMDADLSHDPAYLPAFVAAARSGADLVVASRYIPGGSTPDWTLDRKILSRGGNLYARFFLGRRLTDYTGGYNLFSTDLLRRLNVNTISATGYGFQIALKYRALRATRSVREIPIVFLDRTRGTSKIPGNTLRESLLLVLEMRFQGKHR